MCSIRNLFCQRRRGGQRQRHHPPNLNYVFVFSYSLLWWIFCLVPQQQKYKGETCIIIESTVCSIGNLFCQRRRGGQRQRHHPPNLNYVFVFSYSLLFHSQTVVSRTVMFDSEVFREWGTSSPFHRCHVGQWIYSCQPRFGFLGLCQARQTRGKVSKKYRGMIVSTT